MSAATGTALPLLGDFVQDLRVRQDPFPFQDRDNRGDLEGVGDRQFLDGDHLLPGGVFGPGSSIKGCFNSSATTPMPRPA